MKVVAIVQARMGSTRFPNKVMKPICGRSMIDLLLARLSKASEIDEIVVATSIDQNNKSLVAHIQSLGHNCTLGSELDVLRRYLIAAQSYSADVIVRITGDCPLVDSALVDQLIHKFISSKVDYLSNISPPTYPDGLDIEVFSFKALSLADKNAITLYDREHVTPYIRESGLFNCDCVTNNLDLSYMRWTVDDEEDYEVVKRVFEYFSPDIHFSWKDILELEATTPEIFLTNRNSIRNEGGAMSKGQKLWRRAKRIIPGGNMLLSKRAEMFLPEQWPSYFTRAKGCEVWDLDGRKYTDMSVMGVGTNILGYGHPEVDESVLEVVNLGNMSTLNCPEEVYLAEKLLEMHSWADMARFARSGGEANAIAVRIARAASGRDNIAVCGYHGWHDWYLSANLGDHENLAGHLLPGLSTLGVPEGLRGTVYPFNYNNYIELENLVKNNNIGVIKMEVLRNKDPDIDFLSRVRSLATQHGIVLIFDECTSGFRQAFGGIHKLYGVEPDIAVFGKALGNGYAISAVLGRRSVMESAQSTFISSTFWTERIGPAAALKTLEVMEKIESWKTITELGMRVRDGWQNLATKYDISINCWGIPALSGFTFNNDKNLEYKTLISQEMLEQGYLASNVVYLSIAHNSQLIDNYINALEPIFSVIHECQNGRDINKLLKGPVCHSGFRRLN